ncbi:DUF1456 family protein [Nitratifractor sp.]
MKPGQILYRIGEALKLDRETILRAYALEEYPMSEERLDTILAKPSSKRHEPAEYEELGVFLDGLIHLKRGAVLNRPPDDAEIPLDNNLVLKKLRIALQLKEMDLEAIFALGGRELSRGQMRDLFRAPDHPRYRPCPDAWLNDFLVGLEEYCYDLPPSN